MGDFTDTRLVAYASKIGLDMNAFNKCFEANTYASFINQDAQAGSAMGVPPTPGIFVNGKMVFNSQGQNLVPAYDDISKAVSEAAGNQ